LNSANYSGAFGLDETQKIYIFIFNKQLQKNYGSLTSADEQHASFYICCLLINKKHIKIVTQYILAAFKPVNVNFNNQD
jgi:hypothetical protein